MIYVSHRVKSVFLKNAEKDILDNDLRYTRGQITAVERLEKALRYLEYNQ